MAMQHLCFFVVLALLAPSNAGEGVTIQCKDTLPVLCHPYRSAMCAMLKDERMLILVAQVEKVISELDGWDEANRGQWDAAIGDFKSLFVVNVRGTGGGGLCAWFSWLFVYALGERHHPRTEEHHRKRENECDC